MVVMRIVVVNCDPEEVQSISDLILEKNLGVNLTVIGNVTRVFRSDDDVTEKKQAIIIIYTTRKLTDNIIEILEEKNFEYPVNPAVDPAELLSSWGDFQADPLDVNFLQSNHGKALELLGQAARW